MSSSTMPEKSHPRRPFAGLPPKPRPFDLTEPFDNHGVWCFWITAELPVLRLIAELHCILYSGFNLSPFNQLAQQRVLYTINPRYDHQEAWLWIHELLETETRNLELSEAWENALDDICRDETECSDEGWGE